jgi:Na+-driven multidrug efflux pump
MLMRSVGNARVPGIIMTASSAMQVVMAPILIFGIPGMWEGLGFPGAAWGFVISRALAFCYTLYALNSMRLLDYQLPAAPQLWASWRDVLAIGIPSAMNNLVGPASMAITVVLLAGHSHIIVAGFGVASRIESLAIMVLMALSASTGPFVGQNWGARNYERIFEVHKIAYRFCYLYGIGIFVLLAATGYPLVGLIIDDAEVVEATFTYLLIMPITYGLLGVGMIVGATFTALGKPMPALALSVGRTLLLYLPMALAGNQLFGYQGIFGAAALANVITCIVSIWWMKVYLKRVVPTDAGKDRSARSDPT